MKSLTPDEVWLAGQLEPIRALLGGPLTAAQLSTAEHQLASVIERQARRPAQPVDAKLVLKEMLSTLVTRIGAMGDSTGQLLREDRQSTSRSSRRRPTIESMSHVVSGLLTDTTSMRGDLALIARRARSRAAQGRDL